MIFSGPALLAFDEITLPEPFFQTAFPLYFTLKSMMIEVVSNLTETTRHSYERIEMTDEPLAPGLLVSMPNLNDTYFQKSVILLCEYNRESAFGVMINRPSHIQIKDLIVSDSDLAQLENAPFLVGGPVQPEFLWGVHTPDFSGESTTQVHMSCYMSSVHEILASLVEGNGPKNYHLGFGYAGWSAGQLDQELREGAWWLAPLDSQLILDLPYEQRWETVLDSLGIDPIVANFSNTGEA